MVVFPFALHITGPFPSYIVVAPYISAGMSLILKPAVQNGAYFSLVIYKAAGGFQAEVSKYSIQSQVTMNDLFVSGLFVE